MLRLSEVTAGYRGGRPVLHRVCADFSPGQITGVVGPNGSGKTTLVRVASRALRPREGSVLLEERDIWRMTARCFARRVAVVTQDTLVPFDLSVLDVVLLGRHPHVGRLHLETREDEDAAMAALEMTGAAHLARRSVLRISGGERQRVAIARALAQEPAVLLLDEPTAHLDLAHQTEVMSLVASLCREKGIAVAAVLHDLNLAAAWCQRLIVLAEGRVEADGPPSAVISESLVAHVWNARMWVRRNPLTGRPFLLPAPPPYEAERHGEGGRPLVHVICGGGSGGPVLSALVHEGFRVTCGVVNVGDSDEELCRAMNIPHAAEAPFSPISPESAEANRRLALDADAVVVTAFCVGPGNLDNLRVALEAHRAGRPVFLLGDCDPGKADYTGGEGKALLTELNARAARVPVVEELLRRLRALSR